MSLAISSDIQCVLNSMNPTSLEAMNHVKLMRRRDTKFVVPTNGLVDILELIKDDYLVLEMGGECMHPYETVYYDTPHFEMYYAHHNRRLNRYKVRARKYVQSGHSFLEVKFKNNKGETVKTRRESAMEIDTHEDNKLFLDVNSPYGLDQISPALRNQFLRITLVSKHRPERVTLDVGLSFSLPNGENEITLPHTSIIEVKRDLDGGASDIVSALIAKRYKAQGFSKYCMGTVMINNKVRYNLFKQKVRKLGLLRIKL